MAEALLAAGASSNATNADGDTPFLLSCFGGHVDLCKRLAASAGGAASSSGGSGDGGLYTQVNSEACSGLLQACAAGHLPLVQWLLPLAPQLLEKADSEGHTPLAHCCLHGHAELAEWLLGQGATPTKEAAKAAKSHQAVHKLMKKALKDKAGAS